MAAKKTSKRTTKSSAKKSITGKGGQVAKRPGVDAKASKRKPPKATEAKAAKAKRVSALDAAAAVLAKSGEPMRAQELITAMADQKLWTSPGGKTPHATLHAALMREINEKGGDARFKKVDRGQFAATEKAGA